VSNPPSRRSPIAALSRPWFVGLVVGIAALGLAIQAYLATTTTSLTIELERLVILVPVVVGILAYGRRRPATTPWEAGVVAVWGLIAQRLADVIWFGVGPAFAGEVSVSAVLLSGGAELWLAALLRLLGTIGVFGGLYAAAASRRDRPVVAVLALLAVPAATVLVYAIA